MNTHLKNGEQKIVLFFSGWDIYRFACLAMCIFIFTMIWIAPDKTWPTKGPTGWILKPLILSWVFAFALSSLCSVLRRTNDTYSYGEEGWKMCIFNGAVIGSALGLFIGMLFSFIVTAVFLFGELDPEMVTFDEYKAVIGVSVLNCTLVVQMVGVCSGAILGTVFELIKHYKKPAEEKATS